MLVFIRQDEAIESTTINKKITHIQRIVNGQNFDIRLMLNKYAFIVEQQRRILHKKRWDILTDNEQSSLLHKKEPELFNNLCKLLGVNFLQQIEKQITLFHIDRCWADYLDYIAYLREGIHLVSLSKEDPLYEFHKQVINTFKDLFQKIKEEIIITFKTIDVTKEDFDLEKEGVKSPSATWTYIVNDNDNDFLNRITTSRNNRKNTYYVSMKFIITWPVMLLKYVYTMLKRRQI